MEEILNSTEEKMMLTIESLENKFTNVRAGRANPNMLDGIMVEYYGVPTPLKSLANISIPEARQLSIKPFDRSCLGAIEKAIFEANLGVTPNNNGEVVFIVIPPLTEDRRKELVKQVKGLGEEAKIALRNIRQDANKALENLELPEDEEKRGNERVQDLINEYNKIVDEKLKESNPEIDLTTVGWYYYDIDGNKCNFSKGKRITQDVTKLYLSDTYKIIYTLEDEEKENGLVQIDEQNVVRQSKIDNVLDPLEKENKEFEGWFIIDNDILTDSKLEDGMVINRDMTIVGKWKTSSTESNEEMVEK